MALDSEMLWEGECQGCGSMACEFCGECQTCFCDCEEALLQMDDAKQSQPVQIVRCTWEEFEADWNARQVEIAALETPKEKLARPVDR